MLKTGIVLNRLYAQLESSAQNRRIDDLRLGLSYVGVKLDNGAAGLAAVLPENSSLIMLLAPVVVRRLCMTL